MKRAALLLALTISGFALFAQKKTTTSATVAFDASTSLDALPKAENKTVIAAFDPKTGALQFEANVKNFTFSNPMMQEHFNSDKWLNSDVHPTFSFKGNLVDPSSVDLSKDGTYKTNVEGTLNVKGTEKKIKVPSTITVNGGAIAATASFSIALADYGISGVPIDAGKVSKEPKITVKADFK